MKPRYSTLVKALKQLMHAYDVTLADLEPDMLKLRRGPSDRVEALLRRVEAAARSKQSGARSKSRGK